MRCPACGADESKVVDSRGVMEMNAIRRRRECLSCQYRFTTFESIDLTIQVKKRDGTFEDFQQSKLIKGLDAACCHSRISHDQVRSLVSRITADLLSRQIRQISSEELGQIVMEYLQKMDLVAYIRFSCVYKRIKDPKQLKKALDESYVGQ